MHNCNFVLLSNIIKFLKLHNSNIDTHIFYIVFYLDKEATSCWQSLLFFSLNDYKAFNILLKIRANILFHQQLKKEIKISKKLIKWGTSHICIYSKLLIVNQQFSWRTVWYKRYSFQIKKHLWEAYLQCTNSSLKFNLQ